jgi:cathepsin L
MLLVVQLPPLEADRLRVNRIKAAAVSYDSFLQVYSQYGAEKSKSLSYFDRRQLFETRKAEALAHNAQNKSWKKSVNVFSDFTAEELRSRLGYKRVGARWENYGSSFLEKDNSEIERIDTSGLAATTDWRKTLNASNFIHNQGGCGSCWAHAAVAQMEAAGELHSGFQGKLSTDQIIQCTANPNHCGGSGGCQGATSEEGFERAMRYGILTLEQFSSLQSDSHCLENTNSAINVAGIYRLPENSASHLLRAVAQQPVVVSIDAGPIFSYGSGIFAGCGADATVNHAVLAYGYGSESGQDYWLVKNSWGEDWGEHGYFRVLRHGDGEYCGIDKAPKEGVYCDNAPDQIKVCGMCGIYSDSSYAVIGGASKLAAHTNLGAVNLANAMSHAF